MFTRNERPIGEGQNRPTVTTRKVHIMSTTPFRTATGQTGMDAYEFEAAQIVNAQRELDARMARLSDAMERENEEGGALMYRDHLTETFVMEGDLHRLLSGNFFKHADTARYLGEILKSIRTGAPVPFGIDAGF